MLLSLALWLQELHPDWGFLRVFQYLTFRSVMAAMTALVIGLLLGPYLIRKLTELKIGQPIRDYERCWPHLSDFFATICGNATSSANSRSPVRRTPIASVTSWRLNRYSSSSLLRPSNRSSKSAR